MHPQSKHIAKAINKLILMKEKLDRHRIDMANNLRKQLPFLDLTHSTTIIMVPFYFTKDRGNK
jgi:hypothetical protein